MTATADFLADRERREVWLVELYPARVSDGVVETLYFATEPWATLPGESPASTLYRGRLVNAFNVALESVVPGTVGALPGARGGELRLGNVDGDLDSLGSSYAWDGRRVVVSVVGVYSGGRLGLADRVVVWEGEVDQCLVGLEEVTFRLRDSERLLDDGLTLARFSGSTWGLEFAASNVVTFGSPAKVNVTGALTIVARARFASFAAAQQIISWNNSGGGSTFPFLARMTTAGAMFFNASGVSPVPTASTGVLPLETWCTLAWTVSGTTLTYYAWNESTGRLILAESQTLSTATRGSATGNLRINENAGGFGTAWTCDWLGVKSAALSRYELEALRDRQLTAAELAADASWVLHVGLEEGTGTTAADGSQSPANGTISGATWRLTLEGGAELEGQAKPAAFGKVEGVEPALVYAPTRIYQVHDSAVSAISAVREGGNGITAGAAYTTLGAFLAATTTAGQFDTLIFGGGSYFRLGSNPSKPITADVLGDATGGYVSSAADLARRIVTTRGLTPLADPAGLDTASFAALSSASSAVLGFWAPAGADTTLRQALAFVLGSVGAAAWRRRASGLFAVKQFGAVSGSPVLTVTENEFSKLEPLEVELPVWAVRVRYRRAWRQLSTDELAAAVVATSVQAFYATEWREVRVTDAATLALYPRAREVVVETGHSTAAGAAAEAARLLGYLKVRRRSFRVSATTRGVVVDRFDVVRLSVSSVASGARAVFGKTGRLGLATDGTDFFALGVGGSQADGLESLTLWG